MQEPTFKIKIQACEFSKLSMEELTRKLKLMHDLNLRKYYTIIEDTNEIVSPPLPDPLKTPLKP